MRSRFHAAIVLGGLTCLLASATAAGSAPHEPAAMVPVSSPSTAPAPPLTAAEDAVAHADALLRQLAERAVGLTVAVAAGDGFLWTEAYGHADLASGAPMAPGARMRLYSLAKPMTAVAAARLMQRGGLDPGAAVQAYVPAFPDKGVTITTLQLAEHTSGIRHYAGDAEARSRRHCGTVAEALEIFAADPLVHAPGAGETYSSWGYVLLSSVLEGAAGQPYTAAMQELVFAPLGLESLTIDDPTLEVPGRPRFYRETERGDFEPAQPVDNTCKWGAGAWLGSAGDVARFALAMVDGTLLQPRTEQMFLRGQPTYTAQGWSSGAMAFLIADDEHQLAVALLSNATGDTLGPALQEAVARIHEIFTHDRKRPTGPK